MPKTSAAPTSAAPTSAFAMGKIVRHRKSYDARTGRATRAAVIEAKALVVDRPKFHEDDHGHLIRVWTRAELRSVRQADVAVALAYRTAVEVEDMLEFIPISGVKLAIGNGWIVKAEGAPWYLVSRRAQVELELPRKDRDGRRIVFHPNMAKGDYPSLAAITEELRPLLPNVEFTEAAKAE